MNAGLAPELWPAACYDPTQETREKRGNVVKKAFLSWLAVTLLYTALSLVYFWPLPRLWGDHIGPDLAALFLVFYLLNLAGGCYLAYMIHFSLLAIFLSRAVAEGRSLFSLRSLRVLVPVALVAGVAVAVFFLPYVRVARAQGLSRPPEEIEQYSARLASYFSPAGANFYFGEGADRFLRGSAMGPRTPGPGGLPGRA